MRATRKFLVLTLLALAFVSSLAATIRASGGGGSEICGTPDSLTILLGVVPPENNLRFYAYKPGPPSSFARRDLEIQWDSLYTSPAAGDTGLSLTDKVTLDNLGANLAITPGHNPLGANLTEIRLVYEYFRSNRPPYDASHPFEPIPFLCGQPGLPGFRQDSTQVVPTPDSERGHVDAYIYLPGHRFNGFGEYPAEWATPKEDSSTGRWLNPSDYTVFGANTIMYGGPGSRNLRTDPTGIGWTHPDSFAVWGFCHEFQHSLRNHGFQTTIDELFSSGAEALAGNEDTKASRNDEVPYTWNLFQLGSSQEVCKRPQAATL